MCATNFRPIINNIGKQNKYLNISTIDKETSLEKYFIIATIEVPTTISKNKKSAPKNKSLLKIWMVHSIFYHSHSRDVCL